MATELNLAINSHKYDQVKKLLEGQDSNTPQDWFKNGSLVGPPLALAIENLDTRMLRLLVDDQGADVNLNISISGKQSTLLICAFKRFAG